MVAVPIAPRGLETLDVEVDRNEPLNKVVLELVAVVVVYASSVL